MKTQKYQRNNPKKKVHYINEKVSNFSVKESRQVNGEVISIFKALERCMLQAAL